MDVTPSPLQDRALTAIQQWFHTADRPEFYLAGYAGSGKTSIAQLAVNRIQALRQKPLKVLYAAYTGKAAEVLRHKTGQDAQTLHQLLYTAEEDDDTGEVRFVLNIGSPLRSADLLVLDECSMAPNDLVEDIRSFRIPTLVLGDPGQLPPIHGNSPFTAGTPDFFLDEIHRQARDNPILMLATLAREGKPLPYGVFGPGVEKIRYTQEATPHVLDPERQVLCGLNKRRWRATQYLRAERGMSGMWPQVGEPVIGGKNERKIGFFNGTLGRVVGQGRIHADWAEIDVRTDQGRAHRLTCRAEPFWEHRDQRAHDKPTGGMMKRFSVLDFAYVLSCHKAQGSSWPRITVLDDARAFREDAHRWLYTAITRAEESLVLVS